MKILFIGCGNMGCVIVKSMVKHFADYHIDVLLPSNSKSIEYVTNELKLKVYHEYPTAATYDIIFLAIKPQTLLEILPALSQVTPLSTVIVSIAAGKTVQFFERYFPHNPIIRTMPNINISVGHGATAAFANKLARDVHISTVDAIFTASGCAVWVTKESDIDVITAVSGSSPAYYFLFTEYLAQFGIKHGLAPDVAFKLAEESLIGTALTKLNSEETLTALRQKITSPNGTTQAALEAFQQDDALYDVTSGALTAAIKRARELAD